MGAERDPAGQTGPGLSGAGYGTGDSREPSSGTRPMGDPAGSAEVHSGLHSGRSGSEEMAGLGFAEGQSAGGVKERVLDRARGVADTVRESAGHLGSRAGAVASQARGRIEEMSDRTNRALEQRGFLGRLQENPLPALGVAFGLGFMLAGAGREDQNSAGSRMRRELRNALMAGLTAGAAQATRGFLQSAGRADGPLSSLFGGGAEQGSTGGSRARGTQGSRGRMSGGLERESVSRPPSHQE